MALPAKAMDFLIHYWIFCLHLNRACMFFDVPQGSVVLFEDTGLMTQIIRIEPIEMSEGIGEYRVYFTYPKLTFSECVLKQAAYKREGIYGMWKASSIYYLNMGTGAFVPNMSFLINAISIYPEDLGSAQINSLIKSALTNDYSVYGKETGARSLTNKYKAKCLGTPLIKQIEAENTDSAHFRVFKAIEYIISSEPHKAYASWLKENFLYNFY